MELPNCPLDITYCSNSACGKRDCERHLATLKKLKKKGVFTGATVSIADFSGACRDYIFGLLEENI